jgi:hypothetical protein
MMQAYDLTDLDTVKAYGGMGNSGATANRDTRLGFLISAYSKAVGRYADRQWWGKDPTVGGTIVFDPDATATISYDYNGDGWLSLAPWECREIIDVSLDGKSLPLYDPTAPNQEAYSPLPKQKTLERTNLSIQVPRRDRDSAAVVGAYNTIYTGSGYAGQVDVTAKWGIVGVDADVELATCICVMDAFRNPEAAATRAVAGFDMVEAQGGGNIPAAARAILSAVQRT